MYGFSTIWTRPVQRGQIMIKELKNNENVTFMDVYRRIQLATNTRTQSELAKILEICQSSISDAKGREAIPSGWYITLFEKFGLNQDWLRYGTGPMYLRTEQGYVPQELPTEGVPEESPQHCDPAIKSRIVTVYSMDCQGKGRDDATELKVAGKLALPSSLVGPDTLVLRMNADNMDPMLRQGAYFGVDTTDTHPLSGGLFVLKDEQLGMLVRRIFLDYGDMRRYFLRSDNKKHPTSVLPIEGLNGRIVGRVSWVMQEVA